MHKRSEGEGGAYIATNQGSLTYEQAVPCDQTLRVIFGIGFMPLAALIQFDSCCGARACDALRLQSLTSDLDNNRPITEGQFALPADQAPACRLRASERQCRLCVQQLEA